MASVKDTVFTKSVINSTVKRQINSAIMEGVKGSKTVKAEINKVLQQANRRIQNIEKQGYASPALSALYAERGRKDGFKQFSIAGLNLENESDYIKAKREYARAMSFIKNPTSTATGARQYIQNVYQKNLHIPFDVANRVTKKIVDFDVNYGGIANIYSYQKIGEQFREDIMQVQKETKFDTEEFENQLDNIINGVVAQLSAQAASYLDSFFK